jgi:putative transposase
LLWSFAYLVVRNLFALLCLLARPRRSKELEILVLRHELAILRRQARPKLTRADQEADPLEDAREAGVARLLGHPGARRVVVQPARWTRRLSSPMKKST